MSSDAPSEGEQAHIVDNQTTVCYYSLRTKRSVRNPLLASDETDCIKGQTISIDGGISVAI